MAENTTIVNMAFDSSAFPPDDVHLDTGVTDGPSVSSLLLGSLASAAAAAASSLADVNVIFVLSVSDGKKYFLVLAVGLTLDGDGVGDDGLQSNSQSYSPISNRSASDRNNSRTP